MPPLRRSSRCGSRVSRAWRALTTHQSICLRADGGNPSHAVRAAGQASRAARQVVGLEQVLDRVVDRPRSVRLGHLDGPAAGIGHPPLCLQRGDAPPVQSGPAAPGLARRHELQAPLVVEDVHRRVDPAEADGLLDEVRVGHRGLARSPSSTTRPTRRGRCRRWPRARPARPPGRPDGRSGSRTSSSLGDPTLWPGSTTTCSPRPSPSGRCDEQAAPWNRTVARRSPTDVPRSAGCRATCDAHPSIAGCPTDGQAGMLMTPFPLSTCTPRGRGVLRPRR